MFDDENLSLSLAVAVALIFIAIVVGTAGSGTAVSSSPAVENAAASAEMTAVSNAPETATDAQEHHGEDHGDSQGTDHAAVSGEPLQVSGGWVSQTLGAGTTSAAYFTVTNATAEDDMLVSASSPAAGVVELHMHINEDGMMRMRPVSGIPVPANATATLGPGGFHVMLMELQAPLTEGETIEMDLTFESGRTETLTLPVRRRAAVMSEEHQH